MDPQVSTSFIPKKSFAEARRVGGSGLFGNFISLGALFVFIFSLVAAGGTFAYTGFLKSSITQKTEQLNKSQAAFDPVVIQELLRLDERIINARTLMQKHIAPSAIFNFLGTQTLESVQFNSFDYTFQSDGSASVSLSGTAASFSAVALQSDQFGGSKALKGVVFSGIAVDQRGRVSFSVKQTIDSALINYAKNISASTGNTTDSATPSTVQSTAPVQTP